MASFVIVSNRLPVSVARDENGDLTFNVSTGGLATAMSSLDVSDDNVWVGWPGIAEDDLTASEKARIKKELKKYNCFPVHLTKQEVADFYEGYANDTLWPLFHYFHNLAKYKDEYWAAYKQVNKKFSLAVKKNSHADATIWVQDYQLMLLPALIRKALPTSKIGFFLHIPFPSNEIFQLLPQRREILEGLLGADLVGFHVYDYARHFMSSCLRLLGTNNSNDAIEYGDRFVKVDAFPIGIDYQKFRDTLNTSETKKEIAHLSERYGDQKIMISVDRLDYSKGIIKRLEAFDLFLREHPEYIKKVTLIVIAVPSRTEVDTYKELRDTIERTVSRINGIYSTVDWSPISYQFQGLPFHDIVALYAKADVALVTPLRDGMNLVAKEYVASKRNRKGVLVLSEMTGAIQELSEAIRVNPNDIAGLAKSIHTALTMKKAEQTARLKLMQERLSDYTVQKWGADFIEQLNIAKSGQKGILQKPFDGDAREELINAYSRAKSRLLLLDYDGTLQPFHKSINPNAARPDAKLRAALTKITQTKNTTVCIVSGRPRKALESWFKGIPLTLVAEHGAWVRDEDGWHERAEHFDEMKEKIAAVLHAYALRTAGSNYEVKDFALVWHYRNVMPELAYIRNISLERELQSLVEGTDLTVHHGNKIIEIKPKSIHKGVMTKELSAKYPSEFVLCVGDDYTDEHMFEALGEDAYTIRVGLKETAARYQVAKLNRVLSLIQTLGDVTITPRNARN